MGTSYEKIYTRFLARCEDFSLAQMPEADLEAMLLDWLNGAIVHFIKSESDLSQRDDELHAFTIELFEYEQEILALLMVREWLRPMINSTTLTLQRFSKKEGYSQKEHLSGLIALDDKMNLEIQKMLRDRSYVDNDYFD